MSKNLTIKDIAEIANVSYSTVSRCLNDSPLVSDKTKEKVNKIAKEYNFQFNANARGLITSKANAIGIVLPEGFSQVSINAYHGLLLNSLRNALEEKDVDLIVTYQNNHFTKENNIVRLVNRRKIDGLILLIESPSDETLNFIRKRNFPAVFLHYPPIRKLEDFQAVYTDHYSGGALVAKHLISKGHSNFTVICVEQEHIEFRLRESGFCDTVIKNGGTINKLSCDLDYWSAKKCCENNFDSIMKTTALFGSNDLIALGAMRVMKNNKVNIPNQIAVVGYDNSEFSEYANPSLTTIHQPREKLALYSIEKLFESIDNFDNIKINDIDKKIKINPILIQRDSS